MSRITRPGCCERGQDITNLGHVLVGQVDDGGILADTVRVGGPRDGDDLGHSWLAGQGEEPVDGNLSWGAAFPLGDVINLGYKLEVLQQVVALEARVSQPHVALGNILGGLDLPTEETSS